MDLSNYTLVRSEKLFYENKKLQYCLSRINKKTTKVFYNGTNMIVDKVIIEGRKSKSDEPNKNNVHVYRSDKDTTYNFHNIETFVKAGNVVTIDDDIMIVQNMNGDELVYFNYLGKDIVYFEDKESKKVGCFNGRGILEMYDIDGIDRMFDIDLYLEWIRKREGHDIEIINGYEYKPEARIMNDFIYRDLIYKDTVSEEDGMIVIIRKIYVNKMEGK